MVDAVDSKSTLGNRVLVRVQSSVSLRRAGVFFLISDLGGGKIIMKRGSILLTAFCAAFIFSELAVSSEIEDLAPLPELNITAPSENLDEHLYFFSGVWEGLWDEFLPSQLAIEEINEATATVVFSWGELEEAFEQGWHRHPVIVFSNDTLVLCDDEATALFRFDLESDTLHGVRILGQELNKISMTRVLSSDTTDEGPAEEEGEDITGNLNFDDMNIEKFKFTC
jgi:hypothetical protein